MTPDLPGPLGSSDDETVVYEQRGRLDRLGDAARSYRWPIVVLVVAAAALIVLGDVDVAVPPWLWGVGWYLALGGLIAAAPAKWLADRITEDPGVDLLDLDPVSGRHRHLRVGPRVWEQTTILSPWGDEVDVEDLNRVEINGRQGYEVMDYRTPDDELGLRSADDERPTPTCVATWMGDEEVDSARLRAYRSTVEYARDRLAEDAQRAVTLRANLGNIAREAAEKMVVEHIAAAESSSAPSGDAIQTTVEDVLDEWGFDDPLDDGDRDEQDDDRVDRGEREQRDGRLPGPDPTETTTDLPVSTDGGQDS
jgi:hypothetical protein